MRTSFIIGLTLVLLPGGPISARAAEGEDALAVEMPDDAVPGPGPDGEPAPRRGEWREYRYEDVEDPGEPEAAVVMPAPENREQALDPYGRWYDDREWGRVWRPTVPSGWVPYADGSWAWSPWGWTWVSFEPWAWTFHYGYWVASPGYGWIWVPGATWGPAWVTWYFADGYVGWAPLTPAGPATALEHWVFVRETDFTLPHVRGAVVGTRHLPHALVETWSDPALARRRPPDPGYLSRVSSQPPRHVEEKPATSIAPWQRGDRAMIGSAPPGAGRAPADAAPPSQWSPSANGPRAREPARGWRRHAPAPPALATPPAEPAGPWRRAGVRRSSDESPGPARGWTTAPGPAPRGDRP